METTLESASDYALAIFVGALFAILVAVVLMGGTDTLRRGVRSLFAGRQSENFKPATMYDYGTGANDVIDGEFAEDN